MELKITANVGPLLQQLERFQAQAPAAILRSLVRVRDQVTRPAIVEAVSINTGLAPAKVQGTLSVGDPSIENQVATITVSGKRFPLIEFGAQQTAAGVTYRLPGGSGFVPSAFVARMRSGHQGAFKRRLPSVRRSARSWSLNLPIVELRGPSVARVIDKSQDVEETVTQRTETALAEFLEQEITALARETELAASA